MLLVLKAFLLSLLLLLVSSSDVSAQVVINEVLPDPSNDPPGSSQEPAEFIELYNTNNESEVDLEGYTLEDALPKTYNISGLTIPAGGYVTFTRDQTKIALNNGGDSVILKNGSNTVVDSFMFNETIEDRSWSRTPNGTGAFVNNTDPTKGFANSTPPTPTPTPTPTSAPSPTFTPTPTPTPTKTPTLKPAVKAASTKKPTAATKPASGAKQDSESEKITLGLRDELTQTPTPEENSETEGKSKFPFLAGVFIFGGLGFMGVAAYPFIKDRKRRYNDKSGSKESGEES